MRNFILFILFILLHSLLTLSAQPVFSKAFHDNWEDPAPQLVELFGDFYFTAGKDGYHNNFYLYKVGSSGNLIFRKQYFQPGYSRFITGIIKTLDNKIAFIGYANGCDVADTAARSFIIKVDTSGTVDFLSTQKTLFTYAFGQSPSAFSKIVQHSDSSYFIFGDTIFYRYSKSGALLSKSVGLGVSDISSALLRNNGNILVSGKINGNIRLFELNGNGVIVNQVSAPALYSKLQLYGGQKILAQNAGLHKFSPDLTLLGSSSFTETVRDFVIGNDTVYLISAANNVQYYKRCDSSFNSVSSSTCSTQRLDQLALCKVNNCMAVLSAASSAASFSANNTFAVLNVMQKEQSNNFSHDAGVSNFFADNSSYVTWSQFPGGYQYNCYLKAHVWVKNFGISSISSLKLNCYIMQNIACGHNYYQQHFSGFLLQPGDSVLLTTSFVGKPSYLMGPFNPTVSIPYCFYVTLPDSSADKHNLNDGLCKSMSFYPVGLSESPIPETQVQLFPNPSTGIYEFSGLETVSRLEVLDLSGTLLYSETVGDKKGFVDLRNKGRGVYILKLYHSGNYTAVRKLIKE